MWINFSISGPRQCFLCLSLFLPVRLKRGSDWNLRLTATLVNLLEPWWNKCLCSAVALQGSADNRREVSVYLVLLYDKRLLENRSVAIYPHAYVHFYIILYIYIYIVFANGPDDQGSIPGRVIRKNLKMVLDTTLLLQSALKGKDQG